MGKALKAKEKDAGVGGLSRMTGRLDTLASVRGEMSRMYRLAINSKLAADEMTKFIYALKEIRCCIEAETTATELADIQRRLAVLTNDMAVRRG